MPSIKYKKISEANIKRFKNPLEREKLSDKLKGKKKPIGFGIGRKQSEKMKNKMRIKMKGNLSGIGNKGKKRKDIPWSKGKHIKFNDALKIWRKNGGQPWNKNKKTGIIPISAFTKGQFALEKHPNWKGGITTENHKIRNSIEFRLWRRAVFERDNFTCQKYGIRGGCLVAHHINNFADFPDKRFAIDNGITLSDKAHKEFHKKYGIKNNTREQLNEFLKVANKK